MQTHSFLILSKALLPPSGWLGTLSLLLRVRMAGH